MMDSIKSVAILKASLEDNKDILDNYVPFFASLARKKGYDTVDIHVLQKDFQSEYGIRVPYHPTISILKRCSRLGLLRDVKRGFAFDRNKVRDVDFNNVAKSVEAEVLSLVSRFRSFAWDEYELEYDDDAASQIIMSFLHNYDAELLLANHDISLLPDVSVDKKDLYVFHRFVVKSHEDNSADYGIIVDLSVGYLFASSILFTTLQPKKQSLKKLTVVFDTRLLLRLVGLEGRERQEEYSLFIQSLKMAGAKLRVFQHTIEEIESILDDCIHWIGDSRYNPRIASPALRHFVENRYDASDVVLFKAKLESKLQDHGIRTIDGGYSLGLVKHLIDEQSLYDSIVDEYQSNSDHFEEWSRREVLYRDVKSISAVARLREGALPKSVAHARAVFVTTNTGLARGSKIFRPNRRRATCSGMCQRRLLRNTCLAPYSNDRRKSSAAPNLGQFCSSIAT